MKNIYALICARGGSKGIKNKNLLLINNKSLIARSILIAKKCKYIKKVFVSTDSKKIAQEAIRYGAEVPFLRPKNLSKDNTPEIQVWKHAINYLEKVKNLKTDFIVNIPTTAPLRTLNDVNSCIKKAIKNNFDMIFTATEAYRNPFFNLVKINKNRVIPAFQNSKIIFRRQDAPKFYDLNTICYVIKVKFIKNSDTIFSGRSGIVKIPKERSIDIDDKIDYKIAKLLLK
jgi:CMP-N-acetylneuraminic acid synthetase